MYYSFKGQDMKRLSIIFALFVVPSLASAALVEPGEKLYQIETKYFYIIYPESEKQAAEYLVSFADATYERISALLGGNCDKKVVVAMTGSYQTANGSTTVFPYDAIRLYLYPPAASSSIGNYQSWLPSLFLHELTHAISLTIRTPFWQALANVFGNYMAPELWMNPEFMIEGVTVSFESLDGYMRGNDPFILNVIQQDIVEGRFKTISQACGPYDLYPSGNIYYWYGGYFSQYLQKKYGMQMYAALWQTNANGRAPFFGWNFRNVYGVLPRDAWESFRESVTPDFAISPAAEPLTRESALVYVTASSGSGVYYTDLSDLRLKRFDACDGSTRTVLRRALGVDTIDASHDGTKLLLSYTRYPLNGLSIPKIFVQVYDLEKKRYTGRAYPGLSEAAFFGDGIVAVKVENGLTSLVLVRGGNETLLLRGHEALTFGSPKQLDDRRVVFLMNDNGESSIAAVDVGTGSVVRYAAEGDVVVERLDSMTNGSPVVQSRHDVFPVRHVRDLAVLDGKVYFAYNNGDGFFKLGILDGERFVLQTNNVSGGVYDPLPTSQGVFYTGYFSQTRRLVKLDDTQTVVYTARAVPVAAGSLTAPAYSADMTSAVRYRPLQFLVPKMWFPDFMTGGESLLEPGFGLYLADPVLANTAITEAFFDFAANFADVSVSWYNDALPVNFYAAFSDKLYLLNKTSGSEERVTFAGAGLSFYYGLRDTSQYAGFSASASALRRSYGVTNTSAYGWTRTNDLYLASAKLVYSSLTGIYFKYFKFTGFSATLSADYNIAESEALGEFRFVAGFPVWRGFVRLGAAYCGLPVLNTTASSALFSSADYPAFKEYSSTNLASNYYLDGSVNVLFHSFEVQQGPGTLPLYLKRVYAYGGYRAAYLDGVYLHSVYARVTAELGVYGVLDYHAGVECSCALNNGSFYYGFTVESAGDQLWMKVRDRGRTDPTENF